jgi:hypothetical protein
MYEIVRKAKISCSSAFKNVQRELLKSYEVAYNCGLRAENCNINMYSREYAEKTNIQIDTVSACVLHFRYELYLR